MILKDCANKWGENPLLQRFFVYQNELKSTPDIESETMKIINVGIEEDTARKLAEQIVKEKEELTLKYRSKISELTELLTVDQLTGLNNKRGYEEQIQMNLGLAIRESKKNIENNKEIQPVKLSILMVDIDKFKHINDILGHEKGDEILKTFGKITKNTCRETDYPARIGGEEFIIIFPKTNGESVIGAERLRKKMEEGLRPILDKALENLLTEKGDEEVYNRAKNLGLLKEIGIEPGDEKEFKDISEENKNKIYPIVKKGLLGTISIGIATYEKDDTEKSLKERADNALMEAKSQGRNCVVNSKQEIKNKINEITKEVMKKQQIADKIDELINKIPQEIKEEAKEIIKKLPEYERKNAEKIIEIFLPKKPDKIIDVLRLYAA